MDLVDVDPLPVCREHHAAFTFFDYLVVQMEILGSGAAGSWRLANQSPGGQQQIEKQILVLIVLEVPFVGQQRLKTLRDACPNRS